MSQIRKLPGTLLSKKFKKFKINPNTVVTCSDKYLGISSQRKATNKLAAFWPKST